MKTTDRKNSGSILFEIHHLGLTQKVTAIDSQTGEEASILGPSSAPLLTLQYMAMKKLTQQQSKAHY